MQSRSVAINQVQNNLFLQKMSAEKIIGDWKKKQFRPVYWLEGEEDYYIDKVVEYAEHHLLPESEASFNLSVFYGKDANWSDVVNACMRYPMFADKQVVLLKEAQHMREIEKLENYLDNPLASTIFIVSYKEKTLDKRKSFYKTVKKNAEIFHSEKVKDYKMVEWVTDFMKTQGFTMTGKAIQILVDHVGNDLSRITNEIEKVTVNLTGRTNITEDDIERYVGVSKEYNAFELNNAIALRDPAKAMRIISYFESNPKAAPVQLVIPAIYGFFSRLYVVLGMADKSENAVRALFFNNVFAAKEGLAAARAYGPEGVEKALILLHEYNLKVLGVNDAGTDDASLLRELVAKIIL